MRGAALVMDDPSRDRRVLAFLFAICGVLIVVGIVVNLQSGETGPQPMTLGDVSDADIVEIRDQRNVTVLSGEFRTRVDALGNTEKDAALTDRRGRTVIGEVELEIPAPTREGRRPALKVDVMGLAPRETFTVVIDDRGVATFVTDDRGGINREFQDDEATPFGR